MQAEHSGCIPTLLLKSADDRAYPRACGGTAHSRQTTVDDTGLSPRLRGNHGPDAHGTAYHRSIPAPAGEPLAAAGTPPPQGVYPRACGGTPHRRSARCAAHGLSPRLRGNHQTGSEPERISGSIPAPAGEPAVGFDRHGGIQVYPRACGGTSGGHRVGCL